MIAEIGICSLMLIGSIISFRKTRRLKNSIKNSIFILNLFALPFDYIIIWTSKLLRIKLPEDYLNYVRSMKNNLGEPIDDYKPETLRSTFFYFLTVFIHGIVVTSLFVLLVPDSVLNTLYSISTSSVRHAVKGVEPQTINMLVKIFLNNFKVGVILLLLGLFSFEWVEVLILGNALIVGMVVGFVMKSSNIIIGSIVSFFALTPHGIFEIPAVTLFATLGVYLYKVRKKQVNFDKKFFSEYFTIATITLLFAAFVESYITPVILHSVLQFLT